MCIILYVRSINWWQRHIWQGPGPAPCANGGVLGSSFPPLNSWALPGGLSHTNPHRAKNTFCSALHKQQQLLSESRVPSCEHRRGTAPQWRLLGAIIITLRNLFKGKNHSSLHSSCRTSLSLQTLPALRYWGSRNHPDHCTFLQKHNPQYWESALLS